MKLREWGFFILISFLPVSTTACATPSSDKLAEESDVDVQLSEQPRAAAPVVTPEQPQPGFEQEPTGTR